MALKRKDVPTPILPAEVVDLASVGGEVIVQGVPLARSWEISREHAGAPHLRASAFLAVSVLKDEKTPLWSIAEWEAYSCRNRADYATLLAVAQRLSGLDEGDNRKN